MLIPFGSIDPARGAAGIRAAGWSTTTASAVASSTLHPGVRAQRPAPLPAVGGAGGASASGLFPTGQDRHRLGAPRRARDQLRYSDPMLLDDVAADFPGLTVIMAHPRCRGRTPRSPVAQHKANVYIGPVRLVAEVLPAHHWCGPPTRC